MGIFYPVRVQKNDPNKGREPFDDKGNDNSVPVPGHPDWAGTNKDMKISNINYGPPSELDKWLQLYQGPGGTLRHIDPDMRKLILNRGATKV